ncbi:MAG TPA: DciA family protein [Roseiarcus sp.]|nr:DciA family protein [Roseiarcus sp.]
MKPPRPGAKALAEFMPEIIEEALAARGLSEESLVADWPAIIGESIARYARPIQLQWPPRATKRDPEAAIAPSTLVLRVDGAFALEAQHNAAIIVARVNAHLGWRCIERVAFRQGPLPPLREERRSLAAPSADAEAEASEASSSIEDEALRLALTRLGARAIDQASRRLAAARAAKGD